MPTVETSTVGIVLNASEISKMMTRFLKCGTTMMGKRGKKGKLILATLVLFLCACTASTPTAPLTSPLGSPLAQPSGSAGLSYAKPSAGKGAATGRLFTHLNGEEIGYVGGDLFMGSFMASGKADMPPIVSISLDKDPKAVVYQKDGQFAFTDIAPGTYSLVIWSPAASFVVENPGQGAVKVVIEPDKVTDIGSILIP